eukprot:TRINITY_DN14405_c0_g1_i1.p1 TRINITY_DN14405_c0_g1~~TRINITY_DN14405_c0_g1_i1.p1  ORF type:complete len:362 (-),score=19.31 TRINITY_DN14405_c0_g1_i1:395-1480(-)
MEERSYRETRKLARDDVTVRRRRSRRSQVDSFCDSLPCDVARACIDTDFADRLPKCALALAARGFRHPRTHSTVSLLLVFFLWCAVVTLGVVAEHPAMGDVSRTSARNSERMPHVNATGMRWLWGTAVLATVDEKATRSNSHTVTYLRKLAATEMPEIRSNRNGAWQSRNKAFLDPSSHDSKSGVRGHIKRIRGAVSRALRQYLVDQIGDEAVNYRIEIEASWANVNPQCGINGPHVHPFSAISGAYYISCGGNATSQMPCAISLVDPRPSSALAHLPGEVRDALDFGIDWTLSLWPGTVLVFPSWLTHWVPPNSASEPRMTISFNAGVYSIGRDVVDKRKLADSGWVSEGAGHEEGSLYS